MVFASDASDLVQVLTCRCVNRRQTEELSLGDMAAGSDSPHVALLPCDDVEDGGDQEEGAQPQAVHQGGEPLPAGVRQAVQERHAHEGRHHQQLESEHSQRQPSASSQQQAGAKKEQWRATSHRVGIEVSSVFIAGGLVATVSGGSSVHEPANTTNNISGGVNSDRWGHSGLRSSSRWFECDASSEEKYIMGCGEIM